MGAPGGFGPPRFIRPQVMFCKEVHSNFAFKKFEHINKSRKNDLNFCVLGDSMGCC